MAYALAISASKIWRFLTRRCAIVPASKTRTFSMKRVVLYLRVSTIDQTTANQESELRQITGHMGCQIVKVYKDHGISGAKGAMAGRPSMRSAKRLRAANSTW